MESRATYVSQRKISGPTISNTEEPAENNELITLKVPTVSETVLATIPHKPQRHLIVYLEGCVGVGKTTMFKYVVNNMFVHTAYDEPMDHWTKWFPENVLQTIHEAVNLPTQEQHTHVFSCQNLIATSFLARESGIVKTHPAPFDPSVDVISIADRHALAAYVAFPIHHFLQGRFTYMELQCMLWAFKQDSIDTIFLLQGCSEETLRRVRNRNRKVEQTVTIEYINSLQAAYTVILSTWYRATEYLESEKKSVAEEISFFIAGPRRNLFYILYDKRPIHLPERELLKLFKKISNDFKKLILIPVHFQKLVYSSALKRFQDLLIVTPGVTSYIHDEKGCDGTICSNAPSIRSHRSREPQ
uniref:Thymidine kinase n=10 Tax=Elephant endotheliotropic herpesvirus 1A TaxID=759753 RepID=E2IL07_ELHV1|nr:thymidine kinase [Elephant endotheliotropic herpesvirus 1A]AIT71056.1 thymidine kinase [Elephant endotheliotropic herpesvirus 1A]AIT71091.1 thymidine kinase [Elephant endotheliotropic herpesvirus 1A]AIT71100.1 thymidine kinase [Elephant endotheliotropic herpesvirus 1A]AIT71133.1 thymidine kinase [Elephant endotheliotropic herpesvirus 1A]